MLINAALLSLSEQAAGEVFDAKIYVSVGGCADYVRWSGGQLGKA